MTETESIHKALGELVSACGFSGESGTERLFPFLLEAVALLAEEIASIL